MEMPRFLAFVSPKRVGLRLPEAVEIFYNGLDEGKYIFIKNNIFNALSNRHDMCSGDKKKQILFRLLINV
jgi:hypothetical protein